MTNTVVNEDTPFITERQLLKRIPISRRTLGLWRTSGKLPFVRVTGRRVLYHWETVEQALLRTQRNAA